jgi:sodium-dependent phosphate cotransporter
MTESEQQPAVSASEPPRMRPWVRAALVVLLLYLFLVGVKLLEGGIKGLGSDYTDALFESVSNPLAGLFVGVLATVLVQSSSVTTSTIVGLVAAGVLTVDSAVPMIMGANIGTTITNTIVALAYARRGEEFRLAFQASTMHDFFNVLAVIILFPLELMTGFLSKSAAAIAEFLAGGDTEVATFNSPIKGGVKWGAARFEEVLELLFSNERVLAIATIIFGVGLIFITLMFITRNMRVLVASRIERSLNAVLAKSGLIGMAVGVVVTMAVQSSSITTSVLIPLVASGILMIRNAYPITLGANIGTTVTAMLAALAAGTIGGLTIALTHLLFNISAIVILYPWNRIRYLPVTLAGYLADVAMKRTALAVGSVIGVFIVLPLVGILVLS